MLRERHAERLQQKHMAFIKNTASYFGFYPLSGISLYVWVDVALQKVAAINPNDYADDGRWFPGSGVGNGNTITYRHNKRGSANFADCHAQIVDYLYASDTNHFDTTF